MSRYILGFMCTFFAFGCADRHVLLSLPHVDFLVETVSPGFSVVIVSVHIDSQGVICYLSYPKDAQLTCSSDPK